MSGGLLSFINKNHLGRTCTKQIKIGGIKNEK